MKPLIDGDVLRYEVGFAAEVGWKAMHPEEDAPIPPFSYVREMLHERIESICSDVKATEAPVLYLSGDKNFRYDIATVKPYKGTRKENKPYHFKNLSAYMIHVLQANVSDGIEADDQMAMDHSSSNGTTIICSRDKDLRQVPGWFYSWELGKQPSFGPINIEHTGTLQLSPDHKKLSGTGMAFFYAQCLMGDPVDNIPGCKGVGPKNAYDILEGYRNETWPMKQHVIDTYKKVYGEDWETNLLEQGRLLWLCRRRNEDGSPQMWEIGMEE